MATIKSSKKAGRRKMDEKIFESLERRALLMKYHSPTVMVDRISAEAKRRGVSKTVAQRILFHQYVSELLGVCFTTFDIVDKEDSEQAKPWEDGDNVDNFDEQQNIRIPAWRQVIRQQEIVGAM